jgi:protein-disulfide isomerase
MSSRANRKRQLRAEREAREREEREQRLRRRRLSLIGASVAVAAVLVAVGVLLSQGGGDDDGGSGLGRGEQLAGAAEVRARFQGVPQQGARLGSSDAPLRMVEFVDLQCPFCAQYTRDVLPVLVRRYVRTGKLSMELRPLAFIGEDSATGASASASAARQNGMWQFTDLFYLNQGEENSGYVTPEFVRRVALGAGLRPEPLVRAATEQPPSALLRLAEAEAGRYGVESTPTFLLARRGQPLQKLDVGALEPSEFTSRLDAALGE